MPFVTSNDVVTKDSMQSLYATRLAGVFNKFGRSLTLRPIQVNVKCYNPLHTSYDAPAWSTDDTVVLTHSSASGSVIAYDNVVRLKGLMLHELSHLLFTPRSRSKLSQWVKQNQFWNEFNILEDNRIENMMIAKMSGIKPWLVYAVTKELLETDSGTELLPIVWGRKYLPNNIRTSALNMWPHDNGHRIAEIVDEYNLLNLADTSKQDDAKRLIRALYTELNSTSRSVSLSHSRLTQTAPESSKDSQPETKAQQEKLLQDVADQQATPTPNTDDGDTPEQVKSMLEQSLEEAEQDVIEDAKSTIQSVRDPGAEISQTSGDEDTAERRTVSTLRDWQVKNEPVLPESVVAANKFARELTELRALHDPGWVRKTDQGKLNVMQFMQDADFDEMFDQWSDGNQDVTDIECVILLDNSGSMRDMIDPAYNAMWSVKRALDSINASTTVIQFGYYGEVLYSPERKAGITMRTSRYTGGGGTAPFYSLRKAQEILTESSRAIKMLLVITDGAWSSPLACEQTIASMRMAGVLTGLVFLAPDTDVEHFPFWWYQKDEDGNYKIDGHKCEVVVHVNEPLKIVDVAKRLTKLSQKRILG